ncbi:MAG: hypothetical protein ACR2RL_23600 [Gammaproteobacteria bacterium]
MDKELKCVLYHYHEGEGGEFREVRLYATGEGIDMSAQDMGPSVEHFWGDSDYEFGVRVKPEHVNALVFALLKDKYEGAISGVDEFRSFCKANKIPCDWWNWA